MTSSPSSNAITQRLEKMNQLWERFRGLPKARVCRWLVQEDEKQMINCFIESSYLENSSAADLFIPFYTSCSNAALYSHELIQELEEKINADREALEQEGMFISWEPSTYHFISDFHSFSQHVASAEMVVAVLLPGIITRPFIKWLTCILEDGMPENIRLLIIETHGETKLDELAEAYSELIKTASLDLDMPTAMQQLASAGDPADPGVKFRKAFLELSQAASSKDIAAVKKLEAAPLLIAREQGWIPMEIAVHSLVASAFIGAMQFNEAIKKYDISFALATKIASPLAIQSLFNKGSVHIALKNYKDAGGCFEKAAQLSQEAGDHFQLMEARRMHGFCLVKCGEWEHAFEVEKQALEAAEQLEESVRHNSTLPYLGQSLLELSYRNGDKEEYLLLEEKINSLAGANWQSKLPQQKSVAL